MKKKKTQGFVAVATWIRSSVVVGNMTYHFAAMHNFKEILGWILTSAIGEKRGKRVTFINSSHRQMGKPTVIPRAAWRLLWRQERNTKYHHYSCRKS